MELNKINSSETNWGKASATLNENFLKIGTDIEKVKNATTRNKGYFLTPEALTEMYPVARSGDFAYVGQGNDNLFNVYKWDSSTNAWTDSGIDGGEEVNLGNYYPISEIDEKFTEQDEKLSELASNVGIKFSNISLSLGNVSTVNRLSFDVLDDLSIDINYINTIYLFGLNNVNYNIGSKDESYNVPYNKALVYDIDSSAHSVVAVNKIPKNSLLLAYNDRGYISNGLYKPFWDEHIRENTSADVNSKINKLSIPNINIGHYTGYMNNIGVIKKTATTFECLATDWIGAKKGDVILYKGYGYSDGLSWVLKDNNGDYTSGVIDSTSAYKEIIVPANGIIRFSSYRAVESERVLVLDVLYKDSLESRIRYLENGIINSSKKRINKTMVNVGMSIWWLDSTNFTSSNSIDGEGTLCKGYQTLLQEVFEFDGVVKYAYSGYSLGLGDSAESSIMNKKSSTWIAQDNSFWTLDTIVNDFGRNVQLGTVDDYINNTGISTFYGALRAFKDRVSELSPNAIIICSNSLVRTDRPSKENAIGLTFDDYEKAMCYVASKEGWYFVDQNRYGGINEVNAPYTLYDGLHPTNFGFRVAVKPWIEQIGIISF